MHSGNQRQTKTTTPKNTATCKSSGQMCRRNFFFGRRSLSFGRSLSLLADQWEIKPPPAVCQRHKSAAIPTEPREHLRAYRRKNREANSKRGRVHKKHPHKILPHRCSSRVATLSKKYVHQSNYLPFQWCKSHDPDAWTKTAYDRINSTHTYAFFFLDGAICLSAGHQTWGLLADQRGIEPPPAVCPRHKSAAIPTGPRGHLLYTYLRWAAWKFMQYMVGAGASGTADTVSSRIRCAAKDLMAKKRKLQQAPPPQQRSFGSWKVWWRESVQVKAVLGFIILFVFLL